MVMGHDETASSPSLSELPLDELLEYGRSLGLNLAQDTPRGETLRRVRGRQELLIELDRDALLDVVVWLRQPVRKSASKEQLAKLIAPHQRIRFDGLSDRGLSAFARLSDVDPRQGESRSDIEQRLRRSAGFWSQVRRIRRRMVGSLVSKLVSPPSDRSNEAYRFLPEEGSPTSLRDDIEENGLMGGVARRLKGVADGYVQEKLDEIEHRIDRKLDEIDQRLGEWRDREMSHRLRILKATLLFSILVALLSLLYNYLQGQ